MLRAQSTRVRVEHVDLPSVDKFEKLLVGAGAEPIEDQPRCLCDNWDGRREFAEMCCEQFDAGAVAV